MDEGKWSGLDAKRSAPAFCTISVDKPEYLSSLRLAIMFYCLTLAMKFCYSVLFTASILWQMVACMAGQ